MASRASIAGHPIHPMLVVFPIGLWVASFVCDLIFLAVGTVLWPVLAFYAMIGGTIGALLAAIPGAIDLFSITDRRTRRIGYVHMGINLSLAVLFIANIVWRINVPVGSNGPIILSLVSILLLGVSGWLGGEMVYVRGAAVSPDAFFERGEPIPIHHVYQGEERRRASNIAYFGPERRRAAS